MVALSSYSDLIRRIGLSDSLPIRDTLAWHGPRMFMLTMNGTITLSASSSSAILLSVHG